jgi:hypothetical protein
MKRIDDKRHTKSKKDPVYTSEQIKAIKSLQKSRKHLSHCLQEALKKQHNNVDDELAKDLTSYYLSKFESLFSSWSQSEKQEFADTLSKGS